MIVAVQILMSWEFHIKEEGTIFSFEIARGLNARSNRTYTTFACELSFCHNEIVFLERQCLNSVGKIIFQ